ncbi:unnamed protein product [Arabis nemorensis]|uniref:MATH domain-containing protein n=1 Tax=Arabis nemorensis TaxID=586526 RepID=A0A565BXS5_9BRAS|nr:unnamed protein product [Arabis nemorensis]
MAKQADKKIVWLIKDFSSLQDEKCCSVPVLIGDFEWRLVAYPKGYDGTSLDLYLEAIGDELLPSGWRRYAEYHLTIVNQISEHYSVKIVGRNWFDKKTAMWGGRDLIPLRILNDKNGGFLVNGELMVTLEVDVFAPIGTLGASQVSDDDSEWTALDYSSSDEEGTALDYSSSDEEGTALDYSSSDEEEDEDDVFVIHRSQAKVIFEKHPDLTSNLDIKNDWLKGAYVDLLVHLTKKLSKSHEELTDEDLNFADSALSDLTKAGFKLDWLRQKFDQALLEKQRAFDTQMLGQQLYPLVDQLAPVYSAKVTGMLLEMDQAEVLHLIESHEALKAKVSEALDVLRLHCYYPPDVSSDDDQSELSSTE